MKNYYKIIGVNVNADEREIKNTYLLKIKKYHPDVYKGDKSFAIKKTAEINEAYEVLKDESKREEYDKKMKFKKVSPKDQQKLTENKDKTQKNNWLKQMFINIKNSFVNLGSDIKEYWIKSRKEMKNPSQEEMVSEGRKKLTALILLTILAIIVVIIILLV